MQFNFELNLQRMAMCAKAASLWETPHIKNKVREFFLHDYRSHSRFFEQNEEKWINLTKEVLNHLEPRVLPKILDSELIYVVRNVGTKIYNWYEYIKENLGHNIEYAQQIYWTPYGSIDKVKIFKSFWLDNSSLSNGNRGVDIDRLFRLSCNYVLEEHISSLWQQMPKEIQKNIFYTKRRYKKYEFHLIAYWQFYLDGELPCFIRYLKKASHDRGEYNLYDRNHSVEENMFRLSVTEGYEVAAKYFWNKLNEEERERNLLCAIRIALYMVAHIQVYKIIGRTREYKREQYTEICTFLMNQIPEDCKERLFKEEVTTEFSFGESFETGTSIKNDILNMFLSIWPWQEFFIPTLERMWGYLNNIDYSSILNDIVVKMYRNFKLGNEIENARYRRMLHETWIKTPVNFKREIPKSYYSSIIVMLLDIQDISSIKLIVNDQGMLQRRLELIQMGYDKYKDLIRKDKYEVLDHFIQEILVSEEEKKSLRQKIGIWDYFIIGDYSVTKIGGQYHEFIVTGECRDRYDLADKLLDWQSSSLAERKELKNNIDCTEICYYFIVAERYELADKFLVWRFESAEEIKNCKNSFKDEFLCDYIYKLWATCKESMEIVRRKSSDVLDWFLHSEEEIALFKKEKLVNEELNEKLCYYFIGYDNYEIIEDFLRWCLLPQETIKQLKQVLVDRIILQKFSYLSYYDDITYEQHFFENDSLIKIERFVKWAFDTEEKREEVIKKFMVSDDKI